MQFFDFVSKIESLYNKGRFSFWEALLL
jgi:hypothetical protein